ncbi:YlzJ-like family protein [Paenibacillus hodogayensis]|uniref:YlzJ-like family protein n=1 Tax=Paenibacillus hodogayensis TaxID=279208 RepID=A0ABV5W296_9BACL
MILYTVVPLEQVLEGADRELPETTEMTIHGVLMQIEQISPYQGKIVRLLTPEPAHYLNPDYAPGKLIDFRPD